jgi:dihydrofolate reductase
MTVALIWAEAQGRVIGDGGRIPWHLPEDLAHFKQLTAGSTVVMGRRTWESLPERFRPLPGRRNIVVTRQPDWQSLGAEVVHDLHSALAPAGENAGVSDGAGEVTWVIGGGEIYATAMADASILEVTELDLAVDGDTVAPVIGDGWTRSTGDWQKSAAGIPYRFVRYTR